MSEDLGNIPSFTPSGMSATKVLSKAKSARLFAYAEGMR